MRKKVAFTGLPLAYLLYFAYFSWEGLRVHFSPDEMMNMDGYWNPGPWRLLYSQFLLWRGFYRPLGGLFYMPAFWLFGLNPFPYHVLLSAVLFANVYLVYRLARLLGAGELGAAAAALVACYHPGLSNLYYNTAFAYDALCGFFYVAALVYYLKKRAADRLLRSGETAAFLGLCLCALNSKEMAVTLPVMLLVYEWIYHAPPELTRTELVQWLRGPARMAWCAAGLTALSVYGKIWGADPLIAAGPGYVPVFTLERLKEFQRVSLRDVLLVGWHVGWLGLAALWASLFYLAWRRRDPVLRFCWIFMVVTPLPIEFLPWKSQACLYVPTVGWAIFAGVVFSTLVHALSEVLAREPLLRYLGSRGWAAVLVASAVLFWARTARNRQAKFAAPVMAQLGGETWDVIRQFQKLDLRVPAGSRVVFLDDPFRDWDMSFIADLWWRDRTIHIYLQQKTPFSENELRKMDYRFGFQEGRLVRFK